MEFRRVLFRSLVQALRGRVEDLAQGRIALVPRRRVAADAGAEQVVVEEAIGGIGDRSLPARLLQRIVRPHELPQADREQIGRASCRERVCQYVSISVVAVSLTQIKIQNNTTHHTSSQKTQLLQK